MAVSRLEKFGSIFSRCQGLVRSGHLKEEQIPIWYRVYEKFPPHVEPTLEREEPNVNIRQIFYPEDVERATTQFEQQQQLAEAKFTRMSNSKRSTTNESRSTSIDQQPKDQANSTNSTNS